MYRGSANSNARLTEYRAFKIMALYATGDWSQRRLANRERVSKTCVFNIVNRRNWRHVRPPQDYTLLERSEACPVS